MLSRERADSAVIPAQAGIQENALRLCGGLPSVSVSPKRSEIQYYPNIGTSDRRASLDLPWFSQTRRPNKGEFCIKKSSLRAVSIFGGAGDSLVAHVGDSDEIRRTPSGSPTPDKAAPGPPQAARGNCLRVPQRTLPIATYAEPTVYKAPFRSHLLYSPIVRCICPRAGIHRGDRAMSFLVTGRASSDRRPRRAR